MVIDLDPITFPLEHVGLCSQRSEPNLVEMVHELAYLTIRESPLFDTLRNGEVDKAAERLAKVIQQATDQWLENEAKTPLANR